MDARPAWRPLAAALPFRLIHHLARELRLMLPFRQMPIAIFDHDDRRIDQHADP